MSTTAQELKVYIDETKTGAGNPLLDADGKPLECLKLTAGDVQRVAVFFAGTPILEGGELPLLKLPEGAELQIIAKATRQAADALAVATEATFDEARTAYTAILELNTQAVADLFKEGRRVQTVYLAFSIVDAFSSKSFYVPAEITNAAFTPNTDFVDKKVSAHNTDGAAHDDIRKLIAEEVKRAFAAEKANAEAIAANAKSIEEHATTLKDTPLLSRNNGWKAQQSFSKGANFKEVVAFDDTLRGFYLGGTNQLGLPKYSLWISKDFGLQLWGVNFMLGSIWDETALKLVHNNVSFYSTDESFLSFDYSNKITFRTMPNDGTEAIYQFEAWQWDDDSHTSKSPSAGVKLLKPSQKSALENTSVLNMQEGDARWGKCENPSWTLTYANGSEITPVCFSFDAESTGADFSFRYEQDGGSYRLVFPQRDGTFALLDDIPDVSDFSLKTNTILGSGASGGSSGFNVAIGRDAKSTGTMEASPTVAVGARSSATGECSVAFGRDTNSSNCMTVALGASASATGIGNIAIGGQSRASGANGAIAIGDGSSATGKSSVAIGANVETFLDNTFLLGVCDSDAGYFPLCIGIINDDNPGFLFVEQDARNDNLAGVRISKENFMAMLKQFGGEDFTATKPVGA